MLSRSERLRLRNLRKEELLREKSKEIKLRCPSELNPIYYKGGLISEEGDEVRAFVVMEFPYVYPDNTKKIVRQAYYRTSGHNSQAQFGEKVTDKLARGTWIPTNGLVAKPGFRDHGVCVMNNVYGFILKAPFVNLSDNTLLSRFHSDPQLALVSYMMGGGIWRSEEVDKDLGIILEKIGMEDYTKKYKSGCVGIRNNNVKGESIEIINEYIGDAVSWNWHPIDLEYLEKSGLDRVDLRDDRLWVENDGKIFIPEAILKNPSIVRGYINSNLRKMNRPDKIFFTEEKLKQMAYQGVVNQYKLCP